MLAGCAGGRTAPEPAARTVRVMVYNIHAGKDAPGVDNLRRVAELVKSTNADLVLLQEVDKGTKRSGNVDQPARLALLSGLNAVFGSALDYDGGKYGVAILSRWPIIKDTLFHLPVDPPQERSGGSHEPRGALRAIDLESVRADGGHQHASRSNGGGSLAQAGGRLDRESRRSVSAHGSARYRRWRLQLHARQRRAGRGAKERISRRQLDESATAVRASPFPDDNPAKRIDYLFLTGDIRCTKAEVINTRLSDHRPVIIDVVIPATSSTSQLPSTVSGPERPMVTTVPQFAAASMPSTLDPRTPLTNAQRQWVDRTLSESLNLRERVGQMINVWVLGDYTNTRDSSYAEVIRWIQHDHIGGVTMSLGSPIEVAAKLNAFQRAAKVPLMAGSDLEPNLGRSRGRESSRTTCSMAAAHWTVFPNAMAIAATGREQDAYAVGRAIGEEA